MGKDDLVKEDLPFDVPKFDEDEFVRKELISFRTTVILFVYSLVIALITFAYWKMVWLGGDLDAGQFMILVVFCIATGFALPYLYKALRIDIRHFRRKEWFGTVFMHFIFWLGFTLLLANPPFSDNAGPSIEAYATPSVQGVGGVVRFGAYIGDNEGVDESSLRFCLRAAGNDSCQLTEWTHVPNAPVWIAEWTPTSEGTYTYTIGATDINGRTGEFSGTVVVGNPLPKISPVNDTTFRDDSTRIRVRPHEALDLRAVMYEIDGRLYNMTAPDKEGEDWETDPTFPGWKEGELDVRFFAQEQPRFLHAPGLAEKFYRLDGGLAQHVSASRSYAVAAGFQDLNHEEEPRPAENRPPNLVATPGFAAPLVIVALGLVAFVAVRRQGHDRA